MEFTNPPSVAPNPNETMPLAAIVSFATDAPSRATIAVSGGGHSWSVDIDQAATEHSHPLLGLCVGTDYEIAVSVRNEDGNALAADELLRFTTPPLPDDFPPLDVQLCEPAAREPATMIFPVGHPPMSKVEQKVNFLVGIDQNGDIVWHRRMPGQVHDIQRLSNGNLLWMTGNFLLNEIDLLGNQVASWYPLHHKDNPPSDGVLVPTQSFHHSIAEMPSGNFVTLSHESRDFDNYATSDIDPDAPKETRSIIGDTIVEFTRQGEIVREIKFFDLIDPYRIGYGLNDPFWHMRGYEGGVDWAHANGIAYDARDDSYVVSVRHQDALVKIDRETGELRWILGTHANWGERWQNLLLTPGEGLEWQYHQHDPSVTEAGTFMVFDNGNNRAVPFEPQLPPTENASRAVEFAVDAEAKTVEQVWSYGDGGDDPIYSTFVSGAYHLPETGNVFVTFGGVTTDPEGRRSANMREHQISVRMVEVTHTTPPKKVFEMVVKDTSTEDPTSWMAFRAERVPDLRQL
ncbi:MAG: aryl-sulfate sulfotransferase [Alphaproteobacteria bacterium]|nr:aryl-sulfate sulfotransferase [Alphaproteobacteria bacterium]